MGEAKNFPLLLRLSCFGFLAILWQALGSRKAGKAAAWWSVENLRAPPRPNRTPLGHFIQFHFLRQSWKEILQVFGSQEFIVCQLRNLFVAVNLQFFRRCQVAQPKHPHVRVLQVRFPFDFYFVSKLQLFGNCFYNTTKTLKGRRRASAAAVGWLRWGWRRWGAENGHRSSKGKCQK